MSVWKAFSTCWRRYFSEPDILIVDMGTEFRSPFSELVGMAGTFLHVVDVESPWLNGRTERAHQELRNQIELMLLEIVPQSDDEWLALVASATAAWNSCHNEKGFSPVQRVLGTSPRIAGELCVDGWPDSVYEGPLQAMRRAADIRHTATRAFLEQQHRSRLRTALRTRHRVPDAPMLPGMRVWVWRKPQRGRFPGWYGPDLILVKTSSGAYVQVSGALWKVSEQNMRPQTADDKLGWDMVQRFLHHLKHETARDQPLRRRYVDCTREMPPGEEDAPVYPRENRPEGFDQQALEDEQNNQGEGVPPDVTPEEAVPPTPMEEQESPNRGDVRPRAGDVIDEEPPLRRIRVDERDEVGFHVPFRGTATSVPVREPRPASSWTGMTEGRADELESFFQVQKGIVQVKDLDPELQELFLNGSRLKESHAVKETLTPVIGAEATKILSDPDANVILSRWLDVWKEVDRADAPKFPEKLRVPHGLIPKSRWILQGFHDSAARELNRSVPTSEQHELLFVLQVLCDNSWQGQVCDVSAAFTQANMSLPHNQRTEQIYVKAPQNGELPCFPGVKLFQLKVELYGLMTGPLCWKNTLFHTCAQLGFVLHPLGACTLLWYHPRSRKLEGILLVQVDDVLVGGSHPDFRAQLKSLQRTFKFGKWKDLSAGTDFNGRHIVQKGVDIHVDMREYMEKLQPIPVEAKRTVDAAVVTQYRALIGALSWATRAAVPHGVGDCSILASQTTCLEWSDVKELNRSLAKLKETVPILKVVKLPAEKSLIVFCDASLSNLKDGRTQISMVMGWMDTGEYRRSGTSPFSIQEWYSKKYPRAVSSTLCTEAASMSMALAAAEWLVTWNDMCYDMDYERTERKSRCLPLQHIQKENEPYMDRIVVVTDSKSIFDVLAKKSVGGIDKRAGLELQIVLDSFATYRGSCRWVPHHKNLADAMTKLRANWPPLLQTLETARVSITPEVVEMGQRSELKKATGKAVARSSRQTWHAEQ
eukprot:2061131-Amphidinium_carterae.1